MARKYYCIELSCDTIVSRVDRRCRSCAEKNKWLNTKFREKQSKRRTKYHITKEFLIREYSKNKKTQNQIAKEVGCSSIPIKAKLKKYNILVRARDEVNKLADRKGKNAGGYTDGRSLKTYYCIEPDCGNEICYDNWKSGSRRCRHCACKGKRSSLYIDGRRDIKHYCIEPSCNNEIGYSGWKYGSGRCKSCSKKHNWKNKEYREQVIRNWAKKNLIKPNKPEKQLNRLLQRLLPDEYKYVGDGYTFIAGFVPDFINCNGQKKLIELYGDYWHNLPKAKEKDKKRINTFRKYGYKTLIIWEHELKDLDKVEKKVLVFSNNKRQEEA